MSSTYIIVADLQRFKVFAPKTDPMGRDAVDLVMSIDSLETHMRIRDKVSDQQGNFHGVGASGSGEDHNLALEEERRRIQEIAALVSETVNEHAPASWDFAAPKAINDRIVELLDSAVTKNLKTNLHSDLTKIPNNEILGHFNA